MSTTGTIGFCKRCARIQTMRPSGVCKDCEGKEDKEAAR